MTSSHGRSSLLILVVGICLGLAFGAGCGEGEPKDAKGLEKLLKKKVPSKCVDLTSCTDYRCWVFCPDMADVEKAKTVLEKNCSKFEGAKVWDVQVAHGNDAETWNEWELNVEDCKSWGPPN